MCCRVGMLPERVKEDLKSGTVQNILWRDLQAFSSDEINKTSEAKTPSKSMDNEQNREDINETKQDTRYFSYSHKKFGDVYDTIWKGEREWIRNAVYYFQM